MSRSLGASWGGLCPARHGRDPSGGGKQRKVQRGQCQVLGHARLEEGEPQGTGTPQAACTGEEQAECGMAGGALGSVGSRCLLPLTCDSAVPLSGHDCQPRPCVLSTMSPAFRDSVKGEGAMQQASQNLGLNWSHPGEQREARVGGELEPRPGPGHLRDAVTGWGVYDVFAFGSCQCRSSCRWEN